MNLEEKRDFVKALCTSLQQSVLDKLSDVPEDWDGIELRHFIVDTFSSEIGADVLKRNKKRHKEYKNQLRIM